MDTLTNRNRLADIAHYVIARCDPDELGATKLNKALWYVDCAAYRRWGHSLTGLTHYRKLDHGPVPEGIDAALNELIRDDKVVERAVPAHQYTRREFVSTREPEIEGALTAAEVDLVLTMLDWIRRVTAKKASELSHDALWDETESGERISVAAGSIRPAPATEEAVDWARSEMLRLGLT